MEGMVDERTEEQIAQDAVETLRVSHVLRALSTIPAWAEVTNLLLAERQQRMRDIVDTNFFDTDGDSGLAMYRFGILQGSVRQLNAMLELPQKANLLIKQNEAVQAAAVGGENGERR